MSQRAEKSLLSWEPVNERLITTWFKQDLWKWQSFNLTPQPVHKDADKDAFYNKLSSQVNKVPKHGVWIVKVDFSARVSSYNKEIERFQLEI